MARFHILFGGVHLTVNCMRRSKRMEELEKNMQAKKRADNITMMNKRAKDKWERQGKARPGIEGKSCRLI